MAKNSSKVQLNHSASRVLAATVGTIPVALALGVTLALTLPLPLSLGLTIGSYAVFPIWVAAACCTFLAESAGRAWVSLICIAALASLLSFSVLALEHGVGPWLRG